MRRDREGRFTGVSDEVANDEVDAAKSSRRIAPMHLERNPWAWFTNYAARQPPLAGETWMADAACGDWPEDDKWFPASESGGPRLAEARETCPGCVVRPECLAYALRSRQRHGIWGGHTARELHAMQALPPVPSSPASLPLLADAGQDAPSTRRGDGAMACPAFDPS